MVTMKSFYTLLFVLAIPLHLFCQDVKVTSEIDEDGVIGMPLKGTITVTHDKSSEVEIDSFRLDKDPIEVEFLKEVQLSPDSTLIISIFNFTLEPQAAGLQILPEISVRVGGKEYRSIPRTYTVKDTAPPPVKSTSEDTVILRFETIIDGDTTLYPGQRLTVGYRFIFNYSLDLTKEEIPLLEGRGFRKIGGKEAKDYTQDSLNYLEATQVLEAIEPGEYTFKPGVIQGRAYRMNNLGQKEYARTESRAESAPLTIHVLPFPDLGKPTSFNGAIGESFTFDVSLLTHDEVTVGDKITLLIKIGGKGELANLPMPEVCCQPGYSGFFRLSDLPPVENLAGSTKTFKVEMRPLTAQITEIPSLEFSYFNPKDKSYASLHSDPIPIKVIPLKTKPRDTQGKVLYHPEGDVDEQAEEKMQEPEAIEIEGVFPLTLSDLENKTFGTWWVLLILPLGIAILFVQTHMRRYMLKQQQRVKLKQSKDLFQDAIHEKTGSPMFFHLLQEAFLTRLVERGDITSTQIPPNQLPDSGASGKVRVFLHHIEEKRFSGKEEGFGKKFLTEAKALFNELKK